MNDPFDLRLSRRALLRHLAVAAGATAALPLPGRAAPASSGGAPAGTASKAALQYQDQPRGTSACANCANFIAGEDARAPGRCIIVAGDINPRGWCLAYAGNG